MRTGWDSYFMDIAHQAATRASCDRAKVGCVLVVDRQIIATGYNGSVSGDAHCDEVGHLMEEAHCRRTVHAEMNAVAQAAKRGVAIEGARAYVTHSPCWDCFKVMVNAGVKSVVYDEEYRLDPKVVETAERLRIECRRPVIHAEPCSHCGVPGGH
jgi:dCMP deaminase